MNFRNGQKLRHNTASFAIVAVVIVAVILLNAAVGALFSARLWLIDLTSEGMYTLTDESYHMLEVELEEANTRREQMGEEPVDVDIIFCADPDMIKSNELMRYVYYTALELQKAFPDTIKVSATNVWANPSAVDAYRANSFSTIYQSNIIVASGSEFRVTNLETYYTYDTDGSTDPWAYSGEKGFIKSIIAVTRAEAPICAVTNNHGEPFAGYTSPKDYSGEDYSEFLNVLEKSGYDVVFLDLEKEEIPEDCRLILTFDPQTDFVSSFGASDGVSEIAKLDQFLADTYSFMVFVDADTPVLPNLEEFLEEWGISFDRYTDAEGDLLGNYRVVSDSSLDASRQSVVGVYEPEAMGGSITKNMRERGGSPKVVFGNAMSISYSASYEDTLVLADAENGTGAFRYGSYYRNNHSRSIFDVFRASGRSQAQVVKDGVLLTDENGEPILADTYGNYKLMTLTRESRTIGEGQGYTNVNDASYVCAIGSTEFASNAFLGSGDGRNAYGNTDVLLETLRSIGREIVPVGLEFKPLYSSEMTSNSSTTGEVYYTATGNTVWTVVLVLIPALAFATVGTVLLVRRKFRV